MSDVFQDDVKIDWYRTPIERDELNRLMERSDPRGWIQTSLHLGLWLATGLIAYQAYLLIDSGNWYWSLFLLLLVLFVHGTIGPFLGLIAIHELQHRTVFKTRWLNDFFEQVYAFISWSDYLWYQHSHVRHHRVTCQLGHDGEVVLPIRFSFRKWRFWLAILAWYPQVTIGKVKQVWRHANGDIRGDWYNHVIPVNDTKLRKRHQNWARLLLIGHSLLALLFVLTGHWFLIVVFTFGTQYCSWLGFLMGTPQHFGMNSDVPDFRLNTRTFTCSWLPAFLYWNMQYHVEHHMYPAVPFFNLPKLHKLIAHDMPPASHGLIATWRQMLEIRRCAVADPHYRFKPTLPGS
jgi:fatty acid desaturase